MARTGTAGKPSNGQVTLPGPQSTNGAGRPSLVARVLREVADQAVRRIPRADLDERDPGGDYEVHRPSWERNRVDFGGRKGFIRLAIEQNVPVVPVVSIGGQETALFLSRGERLARLLALDKMFRLKVLPISLALPWGLNLGDMLGHIPLPAKITIETLAPIDLRTEFGEDPDVDEIYDHLTRLMQDTLDALAAERRLP